MQRLATDLGLLTVWYVRDEKKHSYKAPRNLYTEEGPVTRPVMVNHASKVMQRSAIVCCNFKYILLYSYLNIHKYWWGFYITTVALRLNYALLAPWERNHRAQTCDTGDSFCRTELQTLPVLLYSTVCMYSSSTFTVTFLLSHDVYDTMRRTVPVRERVGRSSHHESWMYCTVD